MSKPWPLVPLGEVVSYRKEFIRIDDLETYKRCRVQLHAQGIVLRDIISGAEIKTKEQQVCRAGEFLVAEIDAKVGGFGIVPESLDEAIVSSHYFLFFLNEALLDRRFLDFFIRTPGFREQVSAQGSTNYAAIRPKDVLGYKIPLPPLPEQQRIVARIEELTAKIEEARGLRRLAAEEAEMLVRRATASIFGPGDWSKFLLEDLLREDSQNGLSYRPSDTPPGLPILRISAATSRSDATVDETDIKYLQVNEREAAKYRLDPGDLLACRFNGNLHYVGRFALYKGYSGEPRLYPDKLIRFRVDTEKVLTEFICLAMNSPTGRAAVESFCATTAGNIGISAGNLKTVRVPVPPIPEQRRIVAYLNNLQTKVDVLKRLQTETAAELDALLPSVLDKAFKGGL